VSSRKTGHGRGVVRFGAALLLLLATQAEGAAPTEGSLEGFLAAAVPICTKAPAVQCVERGFAFADRDRNRRLSLAEAKQTQAEVNRWTKANARKLPPQEREKLVMGLLVLQTIGPEQVFKSYDTDGDGELTRDEVTADIRLDRRPLPEILTDPAAIDWDSLSARAGEAGPLLRRLFQL
jgi:hypothetical protein